MGCGVIIGAGGGLCATCWGQLRFFAPPLCDRCGCAVLADEGPGPTLCGACLTAPPAFDRARAALFYDAASRPLILGFKHGDRLERARTFGAWMAAAGPDLLAGADWVAPVPLHRWRLFRRRYNQAAILARAVARDCPGKLCLDLLLRTRRTPSQEGRTRLQRQGNVKGAFAANPARAAQVAGKHILLIDDVITTGATLGACARALTNAGAAGVTALALARVDRAGPSAP